MRTKFFATIRPGLPTIQFGYTNTQLDLQTRTTTGEALTLTTSDGSSDVYTTAITKTFPDNKLKTSGLTVSSPLVVDVLTIRSANVEYVNGAFGTCNVSAFPRLVQLEIINSRCTRFLAKLPYGLRIDGAQCDGKTLNIQGIDGITVNANGTYAQHVLWPVGAGYITSIALQNHSLAQAQVITAIPTLLTLVMNFNNRADLTRGIGRLDLSYNLQLSNLELREARVNELVSSSGQQLKTANLIFNDFSRTLNGSAGKPASFISLVANCLQLTQVLAYNIGLSADELETLLDVLISSDAARVRVDLQLAGTQYLPGGVTAGSYLTSVNGPAGRACESLVTYQAQNKLAQVRVLGHTFTVNEPLFQCTVLSDTTAQIDYIGGTKDVTWWEIGDTLRCTQSFNTDLFNHDGQPMEVLGGGGKSWLVANTKSPDYAGQYNGASGNSTLVKA